MGSEQQEIWWVLRAQSGDRDALDELLQAVQYPLYRYISRLVSDTALAEDILQETFILIYRNLRWLQNPELFRSWAYRIASREAFKRLKRERRYQDQLVDEYPLETVPQETSVDLTEELSQQLPELLNSISPASRAVLILHYLQEMPLSEVAVVLGISLGTVKSRLAYGLSNLRRAFQERGKS